MSSKTGEGGSSPAVLQKEGLDYEALKNSASFTRCPGEVKKLTVVKKRDVGKDIQKECRDLVLYSIWVYKKCPVDLLYLSFRESGRSNLIRGISRAVRSITKIQCGIIEPLAFSKIIDGQRVLWLSKKGKARVKRSKVAAGVSPK